MEIAPRILSDHNQIEIILELQQNKNQWSWKLNDNLIKDEKFIELMKKEIKFFFKENMNKEVKNKTVWDAFKSVMRGLLIKKGSEIKRQKQEEDRKVKLELKRLEDLLTKNKENSKIRKQYTLLKQKMQQKYTEEVAKKLKFLRQKYFEGANKPG